MYAMLGAAGGRLSGMGIGAAWVCAALERNLARAARIVTAGKCQRRLALPRVVAPSRSAEYSYDVRRQHASSSAQESRPRASTSEPAGETSGHESHRIV